MSTKKKENYFSYLRKVSDDELNTCLVKAKFLILTEFNHPLNPLTTVLKKEKTGSFVKKSETLTKKDQKTSQTVNVFSQRNFEAKYKHFAENS